ncbi:hypothetical protein DFP72DRAFT_1082119 [Ephemerocybe angulata]|uniref:Uncharacterized protein n=1 Tax=Ephemerocybe angulata TaxID=980116 RepID=A0A8H6H8E7_9AGAR|nr:hypothetical protein DFP72DRAFT_1082119 [Tulosesus angulatus]
MPPSSAPITPTPLKPYQKGIAYPSRLFDVRPARRGSLPRAVQDVGNGSESGSQNEGSRRTFGSSFSRLFPAYVWLPLRRRAGTSVARRRWADHPDPRLLLLDASAAAWVYSKGTFEGPEFPSSGRMDSDSSHGRQKPRPNAVVLEEWSTATKRHPLHALRTVLRARMVEPRGGWEGRAMVDSSIKTARQSTLSLAALVRNSGSLRSEWKDLPQHSRMP